MHRIRIKQFIPYGLLACLLLFIIGLVGLRSLIVSGLDRTIAKAQQAHPHPGDSVAALMDYVAADRHTLRDRNSAAWALGQLRDDRALPLLQRFYTGGRCDHTSMLCQHELRKAIDLCTKISPDLLLVSNR